MKKIAIFGANGNLGRECVIAFHRAGWKVRAVTRNGKNDLVENLETATCDCMNQEQVINAAQGCDIILNAVNPYYPDWHSKCMPLAQNMMAAAQAAGAVHLFPGNVYNYGTQMPAEIDDNTPQNPDTKKGKLRMEIEALFKRYADEDKVQTIILRAGDFFSSSKTGSTWFDLEITKRLGKGKFTYPGPMELVHSWAFLPDMVATFVKLAEKSNELKKFEAFLFRGHAVSGHQFKSAMEQTCAQTFKTGGVPWPILRVLGIFVPIVREVYEMKYLWHNSHEMDESRLAETIGTVPHTQLETALAHSLEKLDMGDLVKDDLDGGVIAAG